MYKRQKYCSAICNINGLMTYIISPEYYEAILSDSVLLRELSMREADLKRWVKIARKIGARGTYMAFVCHEAWIEHFRWVPVLCLKSGDEFFHVHYHDGWMCRECGCNNGAVIMPMPEADPIFYKRADVYKRQELTTISKMITPLCCRWKQMRSSFLLL